MVFPVSGFGAEFGKYFPDCAPKLGSCWHIASGKIPKKPISPHRKGGEARKDDMIDFALAKLGLMRKSVAERRIVEAKIDGHKLAIYVSHTLGMVLRFSDCPEIPVDPPAGARSGGMSEEEYLARTARYYLVVAAAMVGAWKGHGIAMDLPLSEEMRTSIYARYAPNPQVRLTAGKIVSRGS